MFAELQYRIDLFDYLGAKLRDFIAETDEADGNEYHGEWNIALDNAIKKAEVENPWFTREFQLVNLRAWSELLKVSKLSEWLQNYPEFNHLNSPSKKVGLILAGNIPLVGFHDILCVLLSGHRVVTKLSKKDRSVYPVLRNILAEADRSCFDRWILLEDEPLKDIDAIIATGSDNSARYFDYYFGKYPHIIRKNRNSVAILSGEESKDEKLGLADDIFLYFGLGCRNVSKLFVPEGFLPVDLYENLGKYADLIHHNKYANNYDYQRAILLVNKIPFFDNGFLILKNDVAFASPVGTLYYEYYDSPESLKQKLIANQDRIQTVVGPASLTETNVIFGKSQFPELDEYADNIDSLNFLLNLYQK